YARAIHSTVPILTTSTNEPIHTIRITVGSRAWTWVPLLDSQSVDDKLYNKQPVQSFPLESTNDMLDSGILQFSISPTCGVLLSLVVAATAVLALNQEQVNEPIAIEDSRALSAAFGGFRGDDEADVVEADETLRVLKATGRRRGGRGGFRGGFRGMGKRIGFGGGGFGGGGGGAEA
ncbi:unnamed protein product, partial [Aphanomyces euteiches]